MKFRIPVDIYIDFDLESDQETVELEHLTVEQAVNQAMREVDLLDNMIDTISDHTGFCIKNLSVWVRDAEGV